MPDPADQATPTTATETPQATNAPAVAPPSTETPVDPGQPKPSEQPQDKPAGPQRDASGKFVSKEQPAEKPAESNAPQIDYSGLKVGDGLIPDPAVLDRAKTLFGELQIPADKAQAIVDLQGEVMAAQMAAVKAQDEAWGREVAADPELGGRNFDATKGALARFTAQYGSPELEALLRDYGLTNNPLLVRALAKAGRDLTEDTLTGSGRPNASPSATLYPNTPQMRD